MPLDLPPPLSLSAFRVAEALDAGLSPDRLRLADLDRPFHGVRSPSPVSPSVVSRAEALLPVVPPEGAFSHATALALWGLPLPLDRDSDPIHVAGPPEARLRRRGVIGHGMVPLDVRLLHGLPVVGPLTAWVQCGALLGLDELVAVGDALAGRWSPWPAAREEPVDELARVVQSWGSRRGAARLREALGLVRPNVWSPKETELRLLIVRGGLPEPPWLNRQAGDARGTVLGTPDLAYPEVLVAIEYEGDGHRTDRRQWRRDLAKYERFADAGWRVIRVTDDDLAEPCILLSRLEALLRSRAPG